ncbi:CPBP family intramembrane metalloprotease [Marinicella sp. S1101]|uniref:CPBP family intramembrane glutamic endopeptidase n=1 Tax=Marinicella marina TaxID=2996016 RepID=UPI002260F211|nr:CPBP family intramembrane glutamic endopeptidase [Marinicella marina]MCX7554537.1 CPBP family intramembrane metalloprotease [Marinicella marina]MDJ1141079.1 CPBP family intramembrane metalloprotease [Marinicella marina]
MAAQQHHFERQTPQLSDVVKSFQKHWRTSDKGLLATSANPELSLQLNGFVVNTAIHTELEIDTNMREDMVTQYRLEFSDQLKQIFYDSGPLLLEGMNHTVDLNEIDWQVKQPSTDATTTSAVMQWQQIGTANALVIRFIGVDTEGFELRGIHLIQSIKSAANPVSTVCDTGWSVSCVISNVLRHETDNEIQQNGFIVTSYQAISGYPAWVWLLAAWLTAMFVLRLCQVQSFAVYAWVNAVFVFIWLIHQHWFVDWEPYLRWPLLLAFAVLLLLYRGILIRPKSLAAPVWLVSLAVATLMLVLMPSWSFINEVPFYFAWAIIQQLLLGPVFCNQLVKHFRGSHALTAVFVGVIFSIIHAPNHTLMMVTLVAGFAWSYAWLKYENIYANAFSHALLALLFYQLVPPQWLVSAKIGVFF